MIWHSNTIPDVLADLQVDPEKGLTQREAALRLNEYGPNNLHEQNPLPLSRAIITQLRAPFTVLLLAVSAIVLIVDLYKHWLQEIETDWYLPILVAAMAVTAALLAALRQRRATLHNLRAHTFTAPDARVRRDGEEQIINSHTLVPGDVVLLIAGDILPADCRLIEAERLKCNESTLTGATMPTEKYADALYDDITPLAQRTNMLYAGTTITSGRATAVVVATGARSEMGHEHRHKPPVQEEALVSDTVKRLNRRWTITAAAMGVLVLIIGLTHLDNRSAVLLTAATVAAAFVPVGIPTLFSRLTISGIHRLLRLHRIRMLKPTAMNTLGRVTVVGIPQEMLHDAEEVTLCRAFAGHCDVDMTADTPKAPGLGLLLRMAALNTADNDPADTAILTRLNSLGIHKNELLMDMPRIGELASANGRKIAVHLAEEQTLILVKGGWKTVLPLCTKGNTEAITDAATKMEKDGLQVMAVAYRLTDAAPAVYTAEELERDLVCAGLLGLHIPLRSTAAVDSRVRNILFSNESVAIAVATAGSAGFGDDICVITGEEMQQFDDYALADAVEHCDVYCGLDATQKQQIITALQQQGEVVAFPSCRTDEAELLTTADVGIARGTEATNVAKAAADLILLEDNFAKIGTAIREGRRLRGEKAGMLVYLLLYSGSILAVGCGGLLGLLPLTYCAPLLLGLHLTLSALPTPILLVFGISNTVQKLCKKR